MSDDTGYFGLCPTCHKPTAVIERPFRDRPLRADSVQQSCNNRSQEEDAQERHLF
jgi:hypothetical protein